MKMTLLTLLLTCIYSFNSHAGYNFDGCYQLYKPSVMYPTFCLDGTNEEGINGAGVRLVIFHTNTDLVAACALSSSLGGTENSLEFLLGDTKEMILSEVELKQSRLEGFVTFGNTKLNFLQLSDSTAERLLAKFYDEPKCQNLNMGEIRQLR